MTVTATIASPTPDLEAATAKLRMRLREQLAATGSAALARSSGLDGLVVTGPHESTDPYGQVWFWFRGTAQVTDARGIGAGPAGYASSGARAAPTDGNGNQVSARRTPGTRQSEGNTRMEACTVTEAPTVPEGWSWPLRPVPRRQGNGWRCTLPTAAAATQVRRDLRERLRHGSLIENCVDDAGDDLLLAFEELTSNAFRHGAGAVDVTISATAAGWLLVVDDEAPHRPPVPAVGRDRALGGMGLGMVAGLSLDFGWQPGPGRKSVWAELPSHR